MCFFFFKQKTAYEMRISDWSSDVCSSDLLGRMAALSAGYEITVSGVTLDRFCGGGITSANLAAATVMSGMEDCVVAGGTAMVSRPAERRVGKGWVRTLRSGGSPSPYKKKYHNVSTAPRVHTHTKKT